MFTIVPRKKGESWKAGFNRLSEELVEAKSLAQQFETELWKVRRERDVEKDLRKMVEDSKNDLARYVGAVVESAKLRVDVAEERAQAAESALEVGLGYEELATDEELNSLRDALTSMTGRLDYLHQPEPFEERCLVVGDYEEHLPDCKHFTNPSSDPTPTVCPECGNPNCPI